MGVLLPIVYAGNINFFSYLRTDRNILLENNEHYVKQTYRSRTTIYGANGKLDLIIPVIKGKVGHQIMRDVKISYEQNWQRLHWKSLESAYRSSPYFEFYEHHFVPFYENQIEYLVDFNLAMQDKIVKLLELDIDFSFTDEYEEHPENKTDLRMIADPLYTEINFPLKPYTQVFETRHGFIENLSVLDLLFNCGPSASNYL